MFYRILLNDRVIGRCRSAHTAYHTTFGSIHLKRWYPDCPGATIEPDPDQTPGPTGRAIPGSRYRFQRDLRKDVAAILRYASKAELLAAVAEVP